MISQFDFIKFAYAKNPDLDLKLLQKAYLFSEEAHKGQKRKSGDPFFSHPLEVARILLQSHLDTKTVITALLHDTIEDTTVTYEDIQENFGTTIADLVDGVTKLNLKEIEHATLQDAKNFHKFMLAFAKDIRVLVVKLADRLHNMRTLSYITDYTKKEKKAKETLEIYVPLAERIGFFKLKDELGSLALRILDLKKYNEIEKKIYTLYKFSGSTIDSIIQSIKIILKDEGIKNFLVSGRLKSTFSVWDKMQRKKISLNHISDVVGFRVIVEDIPACYQVLGVLHQKFAAFANEFKDYISSPKKNNYQSLHTTVNISHKSAKVEIQIRTNEMHQNAEHGIASHWGYKTGRKMHDGTQYEWVRNMLDILKNCENPEKFLEYTKLELFEREIFCFSSSGEIFKLKKGATALDFAYTSHKELAKCTKQVAVNGNVVPLRTPLKNGDTVSITLANNAQPPIALWEKYATISKTKAFIQKYAQNAKTFLYHKGKTIFKDACKNLKLPYEEKKLGKIFKKYRAESTHEFLENIALNKFSLQKIMQDYKKAIQEKEHGKFSCLCKVLLPTKIAMMNLFAVAEEAHMELKYLHVDPKKRHLYWCELQYASQRNLAVLKKLFEKNQFDFCLV